MKDYLGILVPSRDGHPDFHDLLNEMHRLRAENKRLREENLQLWQRIAEPNWSLD